MIVETAIIETKELSKSFGKTVALKNLCLEVQQGEIFGLVGPDGAGKTTTIRLLSAIMDPTSGTCKIDGLDTVKEGERIKKEIGTMSQKFGLYHDLTVQENIEFYADIYTISRHERKEKIEKLLSFAHLLPFKNRLADKLSGGMKQKLALVCALIHKPKILFLDEPTNGVDPVSRRDFWKILHQLHREKVTIFFTTSYMDEAERANRLAFIHEGKLLACGSVASIKSLLEGDLIQIQVADPKKVFGLIRTSLQLDQIRLVGNKIHVISKKAEETKECLKNIFKKLGLEEYSVQTVPASLEDVFVSISNKKRQMQ
jgi:ABC-2 type transport system ATP-binding protein